MKYKFILIFICVVSFGCSQKSKSQIDISKLDPISDNTLNLKGSNGKIKTIKESYFSVTIKEGNNENNKILRNYILKIFNENAYISEMIEYDQSGSNFAKIDFSYEESYNLEERAYIL